MSHNIPVPTESKSQINKAGRVLVQADFFSSEYQDALELANRGTIEVYTYDRENFQTAMADYAKFEDEASKGSKLEPVLVSAGPMENLRKAYPNLFLDITEFEKTLMSLIKP